MRHRECCRGEWNVAVGREVSDQRLSLGLDTPHASRFIVQHPPRQIVIRTHLCNLKKREKKKRTLVILSCEVITDLRSQRPGHCLQYC